MKQTSLLAGIRQRLAPWDPTQLFAPGGCLLCRQDGQPPLCGECLAHLEPIHHQGCRRCGNPEVHRSARQCGWCDRLSHLPENLCTLFAYRNEGRDLYHLIKYDGYWGLMQQIVQKGMNGFFQTVPFMGYQCITPIPESFSRKWRRTFNPAALLATGLSQTTGLPCRSLLSVKMFKPHQVGLNYKQRKRNAANRFRVSSGPMPQSVLLVDDVLTTGATLEAATKALNKAGVARIGWLTLFRTL